MTRGRPERVRAVVFDLDGTLVDTMTSIPRAYAETVRALSGLAVTPEAVVAVWHIGPTAAVLQHFLGRAASPEDLQVFHRHIRYAVAAVRPFPGVVPLLDTLHRQGFLLGVFTSAVHRTASQLLAGAGLDDYFSAMVCGDDTLSPKPSPAGLQLACQHLGTTAAETVYVGDAEVDRQCAEAAGAIAIQAAWDTGASRLSGSVAQHPHDVLRLLQISP